jgi:hypothetical protein
MLQRLIVAALILATLAVSADCPAEPVAPQAPAWLSWLPHGYGGNMFVHGTPCSLQKGLHGYRTSPAHIGCWSHPLWGWDVNGYYCGPQVPDPDPGLCQLPIGLIYPDNGPPMPNPGRRNLRKASRLGK